MTEFTEDDRARMRAIHQDEQRVAHLHHLAHGTDPTEHPATDDYEKLDHPTPASDWRKVQESRRRNQNTLIMSLTAIVMLIITIWLVVMIGPIAPGP